MSVNRRRQRLHRCHIYRARCRTLTSGGLPVPSAGYMRRLFRVGRDGLHRQDRRLARRVAAYAREKRERQC